MDMLVEILEHNIIGKGVEKEERGAHIIPDYSVEENMEENITKVATKRGNIMKLPWFDLEGLNS